MKVKVCPVCNSTKIDFFGGFKAEESAGLMRKTCGNCGFIGPMTEMEKGDAKKLKVLKKRKPRS